MNTNEQTRLSNQCEQILAKLRDGNVTNHELSKIALKYTSRISDLRKAGYAVKCVSRDRATGVAEYELA